MALTETVTALENNAVNSDKFRKTMGMFATGVTVLAAENAEGEIVGMTANAVSSVSLDPMLVLICVGKQAQIAPTLLEADHFTLSILSEGQEDLSSYFAGFWASDEPPPFTFRDWEGRPLLSNTVAGVGLRHWEIYEGGDHWIVVGEVTALFRPDNMDRPLLFFDSVYRQLNEKSES